MGAPFKGNVKYLHRLKDELDQIEEETGMSKEDITMVMDHFFLTLKSFMSDFRMPSIRISNFGTFYPGLSKMKWFLRRSIANFRAGLISRNAVVIRIMERWAVIKRLESERNSISTWRIWKSKPSEDQVKDLPGFKESKTKVNKNKENIK